MKDEIASFKVTAADIQNNQSTLPGTDTRKKCGHFIYIYIYSRHKFKGGCICTVYCFVKLDTYIYTHTHIYIHICIEIYTGIHIYPQ